MFCILLKMLKKSGVICLMIELRQKPGQKF